MGESMNGMDIRILMMLASGTLFGATKIPVLDSSGGIAPFCDSTGQFMPLLCTMNCTLAPEEACGTFELYSYNQSSCKLFVAPAVAGSGCAGMFTEHS